MFGPVNIGITKDNAIQLLGKPDYDSKLGKTASILLYGCYELFFNHESKLYSIQNDNYNPSDSTTYNFKNELFEIDSWFLNDNQNQTLEDISKLLFTFDIDHNIQSYYGRNVIVTSSNVVIDFSDEPNNLGVHELIGIRYRSSEFHT